MNNTCNDLTDSSNWFFWRIDLQDCTKLDILCQPTLHNGTKLPHGGVLAIAEALKGNTLLRTLKIERCGIGPATRVWTLARSQWQHHMVRNVWVLLRCCY